MTLVDKIRDMIGEGHTEQSLNELYTYVKENNADIIDNLVLLRSRLQSLNQSHDMGTTSREDYDIGVSKINDAILKLLPQLTPEYIAEASKRKQKTEQVTTFAPAAERTQSSQTVGTTASTDYKKYLIGGGGALLLSILLISLCGEDPVAVETATIPEVTTSAPAASDDNQNQVAKTSNSGTYTLSPTDDAYLIKVVDEHDGHAIWTNAKGDVCFELDGKDKFVEKSNGVVRFNFEIIDASKNHLLLFDSSRNMIIKIDDNTAEFHYDGETEFKTLATGGWTH